MAENGSREVRELRSLPLEDLISAPLNAVIKAQTEAAMSTADFIKRVGFVDPKNKSLFDRLEQDDSSDVRIAAIRVRKKGLNDQGEVVDIEELVEIPYISLFNIPAFEIDSLDWSFDVKLKRIEAFETDLNTVIETEQSGTGNAGGSLPIAGLPIGVGGAMSVEVSSKTDFTLRYGQTRESEYNLRISIKANAAAQPRGIERLLDIAERIATETEAINRANPSE
ncbi:DUF2589 domain-containing protein [Oscillatoria sp. CS-180]|uniref:DUF2589 domain-containing protein n=1 Tax=Oscillatoria sp. CS-180 TaxID=3021720 RepID=UPI00232DFEB0|nr:DUF2589 domain-containing protein [Oscillatoria sp. CS-180]MDB9527724.1 DUF2589 domain-containing protein [Oscillatoria sp. CS-180]